MVDDVLTEDELFYVRRLWRVFWHCVPRASADDRCREGHV